MTDVSRTHLSIAAGWREWVSLPELGVEWVKAKLDTGARSSAIHAFGLEEFEKNGEPWVRFEVHPWQRSSEDSAVAEYPVHDQRIVRSSTGHEQMRYVVLMKVRLLKRTVTAEVTLSRRDEMGFRLLLGREVLRKGGFLVDPGHSYLGGRPKRVVRRKNRGK